MHINLLRVFNRWEVTKASRLKLEKEFNNYTGWIDIFELHVPYTKYNLLEEAMQRTAKYKGKKICVFNGDSINLDMFSKYYPMSGTKSLPSEEIRALITVLKYAEKVYDRIIFLVTNHEQRLWKVLFYYMKSGEIASEILKQMKSLQEVFEKNELKKIIIVEHYLFQIGDIICCHFENNSVVPGVVPRNLVQYLIPRIQKDWTVAFQSHTHTQSKIAIDRKVIIETGTMTDSFDYWRSGKMAGRNKLSSIGYAVCEMKNGIATECSFRILGWEGYL